MDRSSFIETLDRLGAEDDKTVLEAARAVHGFMRENGLSWDDLLVPEGDGDMAGEDREPKGEAHDDDSDSDAAVDETVEEDEHRDEDDDGDDDEADDDVADDDEAGEADDDEDEPLAAHPAEDAKVVDRLLARKTLSRELREELNGFKREIAEGTLTEMDSRYIRALARRLGP